MMFKVRLDCDEFIITETCEKYQAVILFVEQVHPNIPERFLQRLLCLRVLGPFRQAYMVVRGRREGCLLVQLVF